MLEKQPGTLFRVICLILTTVPAELGAPSAPVVYVAGDGSGDYKCDGKADHVQINQALKFASRTQQNCPLKVTLLHIDLLSLLVVTRSLKEDSSATIELQG